MSARAAARLESLGFDRVYRYTAGKMDWLANDLPAGGAKADQTRIGDIARRDVQTCRVTDSVAAARERMARDEAGVCVVVTDDDVVLGLLRAGDLAGVDAGTPVEQIMEAGPDTYRPSNDTESVLEYMKSSDTDVVLVTTSEGELLGMVGREDVERATRSEQAG